VNVTGIMAPGDTLFLDALEGGQVKEIFVDVGDRVKEGEPILALENTDLEMDELLKEARIIEKEYELQRARVNCSKLRHKLKEELIDLEFRLTRFKKDYHRNISLAKSHYIAAGEFENIEDGFLYWKEKKAILIQTMAIEERLNEKTIKQIEAGLDLLKTDFKKTRKRLKDLLLTAPATGLLTNLDASVGETKNKGARIGQIDLTDQVKVIARVDEYYAGRVLIGNTGTLEVYNTESDQETTYALRVTTISPEVRNNEFEVEFAFVKTSPATARLGQSFTVRVALGRQYETLVLKKGPFVKTTGGSWVYVVGDNADKGTRRAIKIGKHNPEYFEVLDGLTEGEKVIISTYDNYRGVDEIELN
jgi:HlyD family secretion protein